jgi:(S)-2-hydroxy-acid oxidase
VFALYQSARHNKKKTMSNLISLDEYEERALKILPERARDYYRSGAGDENSLAWNREDFRNFRIRPRVLRDVSERDTSVSVFNNKVTFPIGISPTAMQRMAHEEGEVATAKGTLQN